MCNGDHETQHNDVCHHLYPHLLGESRGWYGIDFYILRSTLRIDFNKARVRKKIAPFDQFRDIYIESLLGHTHQNLGILHIRILDGIRGDHYLCSASATTGLRAVRLYEGSIFFLENGCSFAKDIPGQDNPLASESRNYDLLVFAFSGHHPS